jgi:hypothetical protein
MAVGAGLFLTLGVIAGLVESSSVSRTDVRSLPPVRLEGTTSVHLFSPFNDDGRLLPQFAPSSHLEGSCWTGSLGSPSRSDAWRCRSGNSILDPCFAPDPLVFPVGHVYCFSDPWDSSPIDLETKRLPLHKANGQDPHGLPALPWGVELEGGTRCVSLQTALTPSFAGTQWTYTCDDGGVILGYVKQSRQGWVSLYGRLNESADVYWASASALWY